MVKISFQTETNLAAGSGGVSERSGTKSSSRAQSSSESVSPFELMLDSDRDGICLPPDADMVAAMFGVDMLVRFNLGVSCWFMVGVCVPDES